MSISPWYYLTPTEPVRLARVSARLAYVTDKINASEEPVPVELYEATFAVQEALVSLEKGEVVMLETTDNKVGMALCWLLA